MRFTQFLKGIVFLTVLALVYIHMQMQIIDLAYQGKAKEQHMRDLIDENGKVTYNILTLKSANHLGVKMLSEDSDMRFMASDNIVHITTPEELSESHSSQEPPEEKKKIPLLSWLSSGRIAEARPQP